MKKALALLTLLFAAGILTAIGEGPGEVVWPGDANLTDAEYAQLEDIGYTAPAWDATGETHVIWPDCWDTQNQDNLGHWFPYSMGDVSSGNFRSPSAVCWMPEQTHYIMVDEYCSGSAVIATAVNITGITKANPAVVTAAAHGLSTGDLIWIKDVGGMTEVNDRYFTVTYLSASTFSLDDEDSTGHTAYVANGTLQRYFTKTDGSHASGRAYDYGYSDGRFCTVDGDCAQASEVCLSPMWDTTGNPDAITIPDHDFGSAGSVYPLSVAVLVGSASQEPLHWDATADCTGLNTPKTCCSGAGAGSCSGYPTCTPSNISPAKDYWVSVVDANTINLYEDDGDLVQEVGGDDGALNCTDMKGWQGIEIVPNDPDGTIRDENTLFQVTLQQSWLATNDAGAACAAAPICDPWVTSAELTYGRPEWMGYGTNACGFRHGWKTMHFDGEYASSRVIGLCELDPGECLQPLGYSGGSGELETLNTQGAVLTVIEATGMTRKER